MNTTKNETVGMIISGAPFVKARFDTEYQGAKLTLKKGRVIYGAGGLHHWTETQTREGGWTRGVPHVLDTTSDDLTRASASYVVIDVDRVPSSSPGPGGRDAGYGGGTAYLAKRLRPDGTFDPEGEALYYTRRCTYNSDLNEPVIVLGQFADVLALVRFATVARLTPEQRTALGV